jgi:cytochrome c oxidase subunit 2
MVVLKMGSRVLGSRVLVLSLLIGVSAFAAPMPQAGTARVIEITAERFEFWPSEITIEEGENVELRITSEDTVHGFRLIGTTTSVVVPKRGKGVASVTFRGGLPGKYTFECHRMCGAGHNFMRGVLIVRPSVRRPDLQVRQQRRT